MKKCKHRNCHGDLRLICTDIGEMDAFYPVRDQIIGREFAPLQHNGISHWDNSDWWQGTVVFTRPVSISWVCNLKTTTSTTQTTKTTMGYSPIKSNLVIPSNFVFSLFQFKFEVWDV